MSSEQLRITLAPPGLAGFPISAVLKPSGPCGSMLRWRKKDSTYVLEQHFKQQGWVEVPFVEEETQ